MIIIPAYNEAASIGAVIAEARRLRPEPIVVIDDHSTDETAAGHCRGGWSDGLAPAVAAWCLGCNSDRPALCA
ncbi:glycosyltransferase [Lamprobacter modestohalophilus]|uniref:glycosyltransferase n=1 Tax=Lamprobacter modestohalophilus TaxID=1064514 RepID=UPI003083F918